MTKERYGSLAFMTEYFNLKLHLHLDTKLSYPSSLRWDQQMYRYTSVL